MWPFKKNPIHNAIAYLKQMTRGDEAAIEMSREDSPVYRRFNDNAAILYLMDKGDSYEIVQHRHLDAAQLSEEALYQLALENLKERARKSVKVVPHENIYAILMGGDFEASLVLVDNLWEKEFRSLVKQDYAVVFPARDILAFCDSGSEQGMKELRELVSKVYPGGDHPISDKVYRRTSGKWAHVPT